MNPSVLQEPSTLTEGRRESGRRRTRPSLRLVWGITVCEGALWGTAAWFFADYWIMLPVRYRWAGILLLSGSAAIGLLRLLLHYRRYVKHMRDPDSP